jgi:UrcA family protein
MHLSRRRTACANEQEIIMRGVTSTAVFLAALCAGGLAHAGESKAWRVGDGYVVQADVDISLPSGATELLTMIERSAQRLCRKEGLRRDRLACENEAVRNAIAALDADVAASVQTVLASRSERKFAQRR